MYRHAESPKVIAEGRRSRIIACPHGTLFLALGPITVQIDRDTLEDVLASSARALHVLSAIDAGAIAMVPPGRHDA